MSARTRFNPSGKQQSDEGTPTENSTSVKAGQLAGSGTLQDASLSPKPSRRNVDEGTSLHQTNNERKENEISTAPQKNTTTNMMGIDKPLNIGSLVRPKSKKNDTVNSISQNRRPRNSAIERYKGNDSSALARSPGIFPMSPSHHSESSVPSFSPFVLPNSHIILENIPSSPNSYQEPSVHKPSLSTPSNKQKHARIPVPSTSLNSTSTPNDQLSMSTYTHNFPEMLDPTKREVFPMKQRQGTSTDLSHLREPMSPSLSAQQRYAEEQHNYDILVPLNDNEISRTSAYDEQHDYRLRRTTKRIHSDEVNEEVMDYVRDEKRAKISGNARQIMAERESESYYENQLQEPIRNLTPVQHFQNTNHIFDSSHLQHTRIQTPPAHLGHSTTPLMPSAPISEESQLIYRLFGVDLEKYLSEHIEQYEAAKTRWRGCTTEEWREGANEITEKFHKLIDFVKEHMTTKLSLFAKLHERVASHKIILGERESLLKDIREKLVKDSGNVLGGALGKGST